jgi:hypothetical protein
MCGPGEHENQRHDADAGRCRNALPTLWCTDGSSHHERSCLRGLLPLRRHAPDRSRRTPPRRRCAGEPSTGGAQPPSSLGRGSGSTRPSAPALAPRSASDSPSPAHRSNRRRSNSHRVASTPVAPISCASGIRSGSVENQHHRPALLSSLLVGEPGVTWWTTRTVRSAEHRVDEAVLGAEPRRAVHVELHPVANAELCGVEDAVLGPGVLPAEQGARGRPAR